MSSERIGQPEPSTPYTPKPIGDRGGREDAGPGSKKARKKRKKKDAKRRKRSEPADEPGRDDPDESGDPPHLVDILTAGSEGFRIES